MEAFFEKAMGRGFRATFAWTAGIPFHLPPPAGVTGSESEN
jgi:hypothetical protein